MRRGSDCLPPQHKNAPYPFSEASLITMMLEPDSVQPTSRSTTR